MAAIDGPSRQCPTCGRYGGIAARCPSCGACGGCHGRDEEIARLRERVARLEDALAFYADPESYWAILIVPDPPCGGFADDWSDTGAEYGCRHGRRARLALGIDLDEGGEDE